MFKSSHGSVFVLGDLGTAPRFVGCVDMDTLTEPGGALDTLIRCFDPDSGGWKILDYILSAPDPVTTTFTMPLTSDNPDRLFAREPFGLLITQRKGGRVDLDANYDRAWVLAGAHAVLGASNVLQRETQEMSELSVEISALPPVTRITEWAKTSRVGVATSDVAILGDVIFAAMTGANPFLSRDGGQTWTEITRPFEVARVGVVQLGRGLYRLFTVRVATVGSPLRIAYSDDWGATWTSVTVGSVNGQGVGGFGFGRPTSLWLAASSGYVYRSVNGGAEWTAVHSGLYTTGDLNSVVFYDDVEGYVAGDGDKLLFTRDGGASWDLFATGSGDDLTSVAVLGTLALVGTSSGKLYAGDSGGVFSKIATLSAAIVGVGFPGYAPQVIVVVTATAVYLSVNGGSAWRALATGTFSHMTIERSPFRLWVGA